MTDQYTDEILILAARLYYLDRLPQNEIAKMVNVSQSKVSRMLGLARERGLVRVTVAEYDTRNTALERRFKEKLGVKAVVIRTAAGLGSVEIRQSLGYFAAPVAAGWVRAKTAVAIAGGRAMQALVQHMRPANRPPENVTVVQAMGNIDSSPGPYDAVELGRSLAARWEGTFVTLNVPAILPDQETCRQFLELDQIRQVMRQLAKVDLAFVGVGTLENSVFVERRALTAEQVAVLKKAGAVGEMLGRFYDARGAECRTNFRDRVVSLRLEQVRTIPQVVAVVTGADRSAAVAAAIRGGLIKGLVMDETGAAAVLEED
jgi:DNA-binding transcriptional regulator LsrR (DeoR family)